MILIYNEFAALLACAASVMSCFIVWDWLPVFSVRHPAKSYCCMVGFFFFTIVLQFYQRLRQLMCLGVKKVFLDKLCIDQGNPESKLWGISHLNVFLASSQRLVILWDRSYFTRAWCVFEVAMWKRIANTKGKRNGAQLAMGSREFAATKSDFRERSPREGPEEEAGPYGSSGRVSTSSTSSYMFGKECAPILASTGTSDILFVPLQMALIIGCVSISLWIGCGTLVAALNTEDDEMTADWITVIGLSQFTGFAFTAYSAMVGRRVARDFQHLESALSNFSWQNAQCYSKSDYEGLSVLLVHWFGSVCEFDMYVNTEFRSMVLNQLGGNDSIKFRWAVPLVLATFCCMLDYVALETHQRQGDVVGQISLCCFLMASSCFVVPLAFKLFLTLCQFLSRSRSTRLGELFLNCGICIMSYALAAVAVGASSMLDFWYQDTGSIVAVITNIIYNIVLALFCLWQYRNSFHRLMKCLSFLGWTV